MPASNFWEGVSNYSDPQKYWSARLGGSFDLVGSGFIALGRNHNRRMYEARRASLLTAMEAEKRQFRGSAVLDIGCGTGFYTDLCGRSGVEHYVGVDIAEVSIQTLQKAYPRFRFMQARIGRDRTRLDTSFDIVIAADVLFHIIDDHEFDLALEQLCGWLKPKGLLVVSDIFADFAIQTESHCRHRGISTYETQLRRHGVTVRRLQPIFAILQPPIPGSASPWPWKVYKQLWRYGTRVARLNLVDRFLPGFLAALDRHIFVPRYGAGAPNTKWLLALKA